MPDGIGGAWMSYSEAAGRLNISREAVRRRADRGHWAKRGNNEDRSVRILVPECLMQGVTAVQDETGTRAEDAVPDAGALVSALESHITTLKAEIERLTSDLAGERAGRQGDVERLTSELAAARAAADRATSELYLLARRVASLAEARAVNSAGGQNKASKNGGVEVSAAGNPAPELALRLAAAIAETSAANDAERQNKTGKNSAAELPTATVDVVGLPQNESRSENPAGNDAPPPAESSEPPRRSWAGQLWRWFLRN